MALRVLVASDGFKGCLEAEAVCAALALGLVSAGCVVTQLPLADGGEGTTRALVKAGGGELRSARVEDPLGRLREAWFGVLPDGRGVVEVAAASGHELLAGAERDPGRTSSRGTGQLLAAAHEAGCGEVILGLGGSSTNDAGAGLASALGVLFLDAEGRELPPGGLALANLARIERPEGCLASELRIVAACDVDNPLCGPRGASRTYGPQKGAGPELVDRLDEALAQFARIVAKDFGREVAEQPGAGAAGGIGAGLLGLCEARLVAGAPLVLEAVGFDARLSSHDLVVTGEGQLDAQTLRGKLPLEIARRAAAAGLPTVEVAGRVAPA
ncbi:MAG: glycerate kinase, partial [Planctomycetes bacterium]|nr:glycerate kinase [Planctomycetota bacterium]